MAHRWRTFGRAAAFGALALLLSACLKLDMDLQVSADDTISGTVILAVQTELLELGGGSVEDILGSDAPLPEGLEGVTQEPYEDDEFTGQRFTFESVPLAQFNQNEDADALRIVREGDVFQVTGALDLAGASGATGLSGLDPGQFLQGAQIRIVIAFPGEVTQTNGEADGNTVTWVPEVGERLELQATASAIESGGGSSMTLLLIIGAVVVVVVIALVIAMSRRRGRPALATDGIGDATPAGPAIAEPPAPPPPPATPSPPATPGDQP